MDTRSLDFVDTEIAFVMAPETNIILYLTLRIMVIRWVLGDYC